MPIRPIAQFDVQTLDNVDDALAMLDAGIDDLMVMCNDHDIWGPKEFWTLDKNTLTLKGYTDRLIVLISEEPTP